MEIKEFKEKKIWAVVGSVHNKEKFAYKIYVSLIKKGYIVFAVDPSGDMVDEEVSYKSLHDLPEVPEVINMVINPIRGMKYVDEANELGIKYMWFQPGAESPELISRAQSCGMKVTQNKCVMVEF